MIDIVLGFNASLTAKVISWQLVMHNLCVSWLSQTSSTTIFFPKPPTNFLTCFRGERRKHTGKKVWFNLVSNSQPPGHESDMRTTEPPRWAYSDYENVLLAQLHEM